MRDKKIEGIADIRDEFDRHGMRVVVEIKRDAVADVVLNQLYRFSALQSTFGMNSVALTGGRPELMTLKDMIVAFLTFREEVVTRRTKHLLAKARDRAHVLVGLAVAVANIDEVIVLIRQAKDAAEARAALMARDWPARDMIPLINLIADPRHRVADDGSFRLSEDQAKAILELRLQRLTALGRDEIADELTKIGREIEDYLDILRSRVRVQTIVKDELAALKEEFATPRRTEIREQDFEVEDEDLIQREDMVVTVSHAGYVKRVPLSAYRAQRRGGKGRAGMQIRQEDFVAKIFVANTHTPVLYFSSKGMVYREKVWRLPVGNPQARGKALINLLPLDPDERITTIMPMPEEEASWGDLQIMFATRSGYVRRNELSDFVDIRRSGKIAMKIDPGDQLAGVEICTEANDIMLVTAQGQCIRFAVGDVRVFMGRGSVGVRGIKLADNDQVISMAILNHVEVESAERAAYLRMRREQEPQEPESAEAQAEDEEPPAVTLTPERFQAMQALEQVILTVSSNGFGKRTSSYEYRLAGRGGKGIVAMTVNKRNGELVACFPVKESDEIMLVSDGGQLIRCPVSDIRVAGRSTQGVTIFDTAEDEHVVSVEHIPEDADEAALSGNGAGIH